MFKLEQQLKPIMLSQVEFRVDGKVIKRGKVKVFNAKQFILKFKLDNSGVIKDYEVPYPYRVEETADGFLLDYCLSAFIPPTEESYWKLRTLNKSECSKIHDKYLHIVTVPA